VFGLSIGGGNSLEGENLGFMGFQRISQQVVAMSWFGSVEEWKWDFSSVCIKYRRWKLA